MNIIYDYDLFVIGGGSGGLACAQAAANFGAKVALADYVKPSPPGSKWGLGGTCVNVGCIPKKLMHYASNLGELKHDQKAAGWDVNTEASHSWEEMVSKVQMYIKKLNFEYKGALMKKNVKYFNQLATLKSQNSIELKDNQGKITEVTAKYIVIAVGGRPLIPEELNSVKQHILTSDDIFMQSKPPGKTLVIGASYVALECAGFLKGFGYDITIMVRSILLRGFDQQMARKIGVYMEQNGVKFLMKRVPVSAQRLQDGKIKVYYKSAEENSDLEHDIYDTVLVATGRFPDTKSLGCENIGIKIAKNGKIIVEPNEQTSISNIFAIGDVADGKLELTPPAIKAGQLLASRLFNNSQELMNYNLVATTVFTPLEYGAIGYSEEDAEQKFGKENIKVYHSSFKPLEWNYNEEHMADSCYAKLIVNTADKDRVIGFHYCGPHAGEVTQGYAVAMKMGATKIDFDNTIGIHPTCSEEIVTLKVTKEEDINASKAGC